MDGNIKEFFDNALASNDFSFVLGLILFLFLIGLTKLLKLLIIGVFKWLLFIGLIGLLNEDSNDDLRLAFHGFLLGDKNRSFNE